MTRNSAIALPGRALITALSAGLLLWGPPAPAAAQETERYFEYPLVVQYDVGIPMRDGVRLSADIYRPTGTGRHPAVLQLTPYNNNGEGTIALGWNFVRQGFAYVAVDVRGRYDSQGEFYPWRHDGRDGSDLISWIAGQPWSDGQVATFGASYSGGNQWLIARENNPHHKALLSYVAIADGFNDWPHWNGVPRLQSILTWAAGMFGRVNQPSTGIRWDEVFRHLPLVTQDEAVGRTIPYWRDWLTQDTLGEFWAPFQMRGTYDRFDIPTFNVTGWWDPQGRSQIQNYMEAVRTDRNPADHVLIVGPWLHAANRDRQVGVRDHGPQAIIELDRLRDEWLAHRLLGRPRPDLPNVLYFLPVKNEWRAADAFPIPGTQFTPYYLDSGGRANTLLGDGVLRTDRPGAGGPDRFVYDPANPVPTITSRLGRGGIPTGPIDHRVVETRPDVLVYTSEPLQQGIEVTGPVKAVIYFSTDVPDTDITVQLLDVEPSGRALNLTKGIARARYRVSFERPELLEPGKVYALEVELYPTSNYYEAGHRIRIEVSSSNFPFFARNLNTGKGADSSEMRVANTRIHHDGAYASRIVIPVVTGAPRLWARARGE